MWDIRKQRQRVPELEQQQQKLSSLKPFEEIHQMLARIRNTALVCVCLLGCNSNLNTLSQTKLKPHHTPSLPIHANMNKRPKNTAKKKITEDDIFADLMLLLQRVWIISCWDVTLCVTLLFERVAVYSGLYPPQHVGDIKENTKEVPHTHPHSYHNVCVCVCALKQNGNK